jgi:hypothetical protein
MTFAGLPAAMQLAGIDLVTTLAAAITELSPNLKLEKRAIKPPSRQETMAKAESGKRK